MKINFFKINLLIIFSAYFLSINAEFKQIDLKEFEKLKKKAVFINDTKAEDYRSQEDETLPDFDNMKEYQYFIAHLMGENDKDLFFLFTTLADAEKLFFTSDINIMLVNWYGMEESRQEHKAEYKDKQTQQPEKQAEAGWLYSTASYVADTVAYYV